MVKLDFENPRSLLLSWEKPSVSDSIQNYEIQQNVNGGSWETFLVAGTTMKMNILSKHPGSQYNFKIRARDINGLGSFTEINSVTSLDGKLSSFAVFFCENATNHWKM